MVNRKRLNPTESVSALFGAKLRELRDAAGLSQAQLADHLGYSNDTISKVETAAQSPSFELAKLVDEFFDTGKQFQELQPLATREGIPTFFRDFADLEATATAIRAYDHVAVPGILQTDEYARAVMRPGQLQDDLDQMVASRMSRQEILQRKSPPWIFLLLYETAIRKIVGDEEITKAQLVQLLELMDEPYLTVLVVPTNAPVYPSSSFTLFSREEGPEIGYVEGAGGHSTLIQLSFHLEALRRSWDMISSTAMTEAASKALVREVMESL